MKSESLKEAINRFIATIDESNTLDSQDKVELLINVGKFLDPQHYENNIKVLQKDLERKHKR